ncbi:hypothetical protein JCM10213_005978 [Rhodosporidiobolus nylandii]
MGIDSLFEIAKAGRSAVDEEAAGGGPRTSGHALAKLVKRCPATIKAVFLDVGALTGAEHGRLTSAILDKDPLWRGDETHPTVIGGITKFLYTFLHSFVSCLGRPIEIILVFDSTKRGIAKLECELARLRSAHSQQVARITAHVTKLKQEGLKRGALSKAAEDPLFKLEVVDGGETQPVKEAPDASGFHMPQVSLDQIENLNSTKSQWILGNTTCVVAQTEAVPQAAAFVRILTATVETAAPFELPRGRVDRCELQQLLAQTHIPQDAVLVNGGKDGDNFANGLDLARVGVILDRAKPRRWVRHDRQILAEELGLTAPALRHIILFLLLGSDYTGCGLRGFGAAKARQQLPEVLAFVDVDWNGQLAADPTLAGELWSKHAKILDNINLKLFRFSDDPEAHLANALASLRQYIVAFRTFVGADLEPEQLSEKHELVNRVRREERPRSPWSVLVDKQKQKEDTPSGQPSTREQPSRSRGLVLEKGASRPPRPQIPAVLSFPKVPKPPRAKWSGGGILVPFPHFPFPEDSKFFFTPSDVPPPVPCLRHPWYLNVCRYPPGGIPPFFGYPSNAFTPPSHFVPNHFTSRRHRPFPSQKYPPPDRVAIRYPMHTSFEFDHFVRSAPRTTTAAPPARPPQKRAGGGQAVPTQGKKRQVRAQAQDAGLKPPAKKQKLEDVTPAASSKTPKLRAICRDVTRTRSTSATFNPAVYPFNSLIHTISTHILAPFLHHLTACTISTFRQVSFFEPALFRCASGSTGDVLKQVFAGLINPKGGKRRQLSASEFVLRSIGSSASDKDKLVFILTCHLDGLTTEGELEEYLVAGLPLPIRRMGNALLSTSLGQVALALLKQNTSLRDHILPHLRAYGRQVDALDKAAQHTSIDSLTHLLFSTPNFALDNLRRVILPALAKGTLVAIPPLLNLEHSTETSKASQLIRAFVDASPLGSAAAPSPGECAEAVAAQQQILQQILELSSDATAAHKTVLEEILQRLLVVVRVVVRVATHHQHARAYDLRAEPTASQGPPSRFADERHLVVAPILALLKLKDETPMSTGQWDQAQRQDAITQGMDALDETRSAGQEDGKKRPARQWNVGDVRGAQGGAPLSATANTLAWVALRHCLLPLLPAELSSSKVQDPNMEQWFAQNAPLVLPMTYRPPPDHVDLANYVHLLNELVSPCRGSRSKPKNAPSLASSLVPKWRQAIARMQRSAWSGDGINTALLLQHLPQQLLTPFPYHGMYDPYNLLGPETEEQHFRRLVDALQALDHNVLASPSSPSARRKSIPHNRLGTSAWLFCGTPPSEVAAGSATYNPYRIHQQVINLHKPPLNYIAKLTEAGAPTLHTIGDLLRAVEQHRPADLSDWATPLLLPHAQKPAIPQVPEAHNLLAGQEEPVVADIRRFTGVGPNGDGDWRPDVYAVGIDTGRSRFVVAAADRPGVPNDLGRAGLIPKGSLDHAERAKKRGELQAELANERGGDKATPGVHPKLQQFNFETTQIRRSKTDSLTAELANRLIPKSAENKDVLVSVGKDSNEHIKGHRSSESGELVASFIKALRARRDIGTVKIVVVDEFRTPISCPDIDCRRDAAADLLKSFCIEKTGNEMYRLKVCSVSGTVYDRDIVGALNIIQVTLAILRLGRKFHPFRQDFAQLFDLPYPAPDGKVKPVSPFTKDKQS